jgi:hypothetical protein
MYLACSHFDLEVCFRHQMKMLFKGQALWWNAPSMLHAESKVDLALE